MTVTIILDIDGSSYVCRCFENESMQINKFVGSVDALGSQGTFSKDFFMPLNGGLIEAIGDVTDPSQDANVDLNKAVQGRILINGFERYTGSFFFLNFLVEPIKQVQVLFQGNESNIKSILSNITMAELLAGELVPYTFDEIESYFDDPDTYISTNGYAFPIVDYGQQYTADTTATDGTQISTLSELNFKPSVTFQKCFDMMPMEITTNGIDDLMSQHILLHNDSNTLPVLDTSPLDNTGYMESTSTLTTSGAAYHLVNFGTEYNYANDNIDLPNDQFDLPTNGNYQFTAVGTLTILNPSAGLGDVVIGLRIYDTVQLNFVRKIFTVYVNGATSTTININSFFNVDKIAGDTIQLEVARLSKTIGGTVNVRVDTGFKFSLTQAPALNATSNVDVPKNCPDITAWDIFRNIAIQCNAVITKELDGSYELTPWVDWIDAGTDVIVLDNLIQNNTTPQIKPFSLEGAKSIELKYKEGKDFYNTKYQDLRNRPFGEKWIKDTGTELAKNTISIESPFTVVPSSPIDESNGVIPKLYDKDFKVVSGDAILLNRIESNEMLLPFNLVSEYDPADSANYSEVPFFGNWESLDGGYNTSDNNFGQSLSFFSSINYPNNNLYERFWKQYLEETYTENSRQLSIKIKLNLNQIDTLQFNEKFYYKGSQWRLIKMENIELTQCEYVNATLMKRFTIFNTDRAPFYPSDVIESIVQWKDSSDNTALSPADGSAADQTDLEESANYYGFFYDAVNDIATQNGQILIA